MYTSVYGDLILSNPWKKLKVENQDFWLLYDTDPSPPPLPSPSQGGVGEYVPILKREEIPREKKEDETLSFFKSQERGANEKR
jgi:hypothetical protein